MNLRIIFTVLGFLNFVLAKSQNILIYGSINSNRLQSISFGKLGVNSYLPKNIIFELPVTESKEFRGDITLSEKGMYRIGDGWAGHRVFITPGDTVQIRFEQIEQKFDKNEASQDMSILHKMYVKGKYPGNYTFFDEISNFFGPTVRGFVKENFNAKSFKTTCDSSLNAALTLLNQYYLAKEVSDTFYRYAKGELNAQYLLWMCTPLTYVAKKNINPSYFDKIKDLTFKDYDLLIRTDSYVTAASVFNVYILNEFEPDYWYSNFDQEFHSAATYFKGILRDRLMGWTITDYKDKDFPSFDSLYQYFLTTCKNSRIKKEVIGNVEAYKLRERNKPPLKNALHNTIVTNIKNKPIFLDAIPTSKKLILIDCWASWCMPCKKQLPFLKEFEKKYKDRIEFVYLSIDEKREDWLNIVKTKKPDRKNQYLLKEGVKSDFAKYFNLAAIPRYILIETGELRVVNKNMPLPIYKENFEKSISSALNSIEK